VKERGIIFGAESIEAILAGRKTQTRRVVNVPWPIAHPAVSAADGGPIWHNDGLLVFERRADGTLSARTLRVPYGVPGDRLFVRESLWVSKCGKYFAREARDADHHMPDVAHRESQRWWFGNRPVPIAVAEARIESGESTRLVTTWTNRGRRKRSGAWVPAFEVGFSDYDERTGSQSYTATFRKHIPAIYMPRWASRLSLEVHDVRLERLHAITEDDARAEGVLPFFERFPSIGRDQRLTSGELASDAPYRAAFAVGWDEINGHRALWASNPWVLVVTFKPAEVPRG
jgi:hypothetical protein